MSRNFKLLLCLTTSIAFVPGCSSSGRRADPNQTVITQASTYALVGQTITATLTLKDTDGNALTTTNDIVTVSCTVLGTLHTFSVANSAPGTYQATVAATAAGPCALSVTVNSEAMTATTASYDFFTRPLSSPLASHQCVAQSGTLKCWGYNHVGQLGEGNTTNRGDAASEMGDNLPTVDLGSGRTAVKFSGSILHTCALLDNGSVKCWGDNTNGQLGLGDTNARGDGANEMGDNLPAVDLGTGRTATQVVVGSFNDFPHTCALLDNGSVKCWGANSRGQLGLGDTNDRGDATGEMGDNLPAVDLGTGRTATQVVAGIYFTCALLDNGSVKCWGENDSGRLGLGDTNDRGDAAGEMGDSLPAVELGTGRTATHIECAGESVCALLDNGSVKCWGKNNAGQLGLGDANDRGDAAGEMGDNLPALNFGTDSSVAFILLGGAHSCALFTDKSLKCWGYNAFGQLGEGNTTNRGDAASEMGDNLPVVDLGTGLSVYGLSMGSYHSCAFLNNGEWKCWGFNSHGILGQGDTNHRGDGANEMGDNLSVVDL